MILIPYQTDAPMYHRPFGTLALIMVNVLVYGLMSWGVLNPEDYALSHGEGLTPLQWLTSNFVHGGFLHLFGNMIALWAFGLIVEGKVGPLRFLGIVGAIGVLQCCVEQILFLGASEGLSYGASSIIFGLIGIAMIWAPQNLMTVFYFWIVFGTFEARVKTVAYLYLGINLLFALLFASQGVYLTSEVLHLMGAAVGIPIGIEMLKRGLVDCEGWDWFSLRDKPWAA